MYGVGIVYIPEEMKKSLERRDEMGQRFEKYLDSLTSDQIEKLLRKAITEAYPHLSKEQLEACVVREMERAADRGRFSIYFVEEDSEIKARLLENIPTEPWRSAPSDRDGASGSPNGTDVDS
jgi:hypothetical protein